MTNHDGKEKYYREGITGHSIEHELDLPLPPWPVEERRRVIEEDWIDIDPAWPRTERFIAWCINYQVPLSVALWGLILAAVGGLVWWWM